jgi:hypothetical protein
LRPPKFEHRINVLNPAGNIHKGPQLLVLPRQVIQQRPSRIKSRESKYRPSIQDRQRFALAPAARFPRFFKPF